MNTATAQTIATVSQLRNESAEGWAMASDTAGITDYETDHCSGAECEPGACACS